MSDNRPENCRNALRDAKKTYPRSGCAACGDGGLRGCPYEKTQPAESPTPITDAALCISHHPSDLLGWPEGRKVEIGGEHIVPARVCRDLERELADVTKQRDAIIHFCETEMGWDYFRAEYQLGDSPTKSMQNADKLRDYLASQGWKPKGGDA